MPCRLEFEGSRAEDCDGEAGSAGVKIKWHICKVCGQWNACDADHCFVPDDSCGSHTGLGTEGSPDGLKASGTDMGIKGHHRRFTVA